MANYKLPWNYEPGVDAAIITRTLDISGVYSPDEYASIITDYDSKYDGQYCYYTVNNEIVNTPYTINVAVHRANDTEEGHYAFLTKAEQLKVTTVGGSYYHVWYPAIHVSSDWNAYTALPASNYQLVKETLENSSSWVDTSTWPNSTIVNPKYQCSKYFIPINTNINLNEEFRLRLINFYTSINNLVYWLPETYFVDTTNGNVAYTTHTDLLYLNPKVYDSNNNLVSGALTRVNDDWVLNINATGTYTLYAYYCRESNTLKPTGADDIDSNISYDELAWQVTLEVYDPSVVKVLSTDLYTYRQQGYDWLSGSLEDKWTLHDDAGTLENLKISTSSSAELAFRNNVTVQSVGIDAFSNRGIAKQRSVKLHLIMKFFSPSAYASTYKICFSSTDISGSTDQSLGETIEIGYYETSKIITRNIDIISNGNPITGLAPYHVNLYMWYNGQWESAASFVVYDSKIELSYSSTVTG